MFLLKENYVSGSWLQSDSFERSRLKGSRAEKRIQVPKHRLAGELSKACKAKQGADFLNI